jgi:2-polyprenyl-3-methyl-5-hydroxy-6-metoxy-1,4-benzoquinol methylase
VRCYFGSRENVLVRYLDATADGNPDLIVKVLGLAYFLDTALIARMIELLEKGDYDLVKTPDDFSMRIGGAVVKRDALVRLWELISKGEIVHSRIVHNIADILVNPLQYISIRKDIFKVAFLEDIQISDEVLRDMRMKAKDIYVGERYEYDEGKVYAGGNILRRHYEFALDFVRQRDIVMDAGCGNGFGTAILAAKAKHAIGLDRSQEVIEEARRRHPGVAMSFVVGDVLRTPFRGDSFDCVLCMETLEHLNGVQFTDEIHRIVKKDGSLVISVPQDRFGHIPMSPYHVKEYNVDELKRLLSRRFRVEKIYGTKSCIIDEDPSGDGLIAIAKKTA